MNQDFREMRYPAKVWAATACAAIFAVTTSATIWLYFIQTDTLIGRPVPASLTQTPPAAVAGLAR